MIRPEVAQMREYCTVFIESHGFNIHSAKNNIIHTDLNGPTAIYLHTNSSTRPKYSAFKAQCRAKRIRAQSIFLKHPNHYFNTISDEKAEKMHRGSLRKYPLFPQEEADHVFGYGMVEQSQIEKFVSQPKQALLYFQATTEFQSPRFRSFDFQRIRLNYEHLSSEEREKKKITILNPLSETLIFPYEFHNDHPFIAEVKEGPKPEIFYQPNFRFIGAIKLREYRQQLKEKVFD